MADVTNPQRHTRLMNRVGSGSRRLQQPQHMLLISSSAGGSDEPAERKPGWQEEHGRTVGGGGAGQFPLFTQTAKGFSSHRLLMIRDISSRRHLSLKPRHATFNRNSLQNIKEYKSFFHNRICGCHHSNWLQRHNWSAAVSLFSAL